MRPSSRMLVAFVIAAVVLLGPLVMALDGCAAMMMCDAPCAAMSGAVVATPTLTPLMALSNAVIVATVSATPVTPSVLEPPPKPVLLSL